MKGMRRKMLLQCLKNYKLLLSIVDKKLGKEITKAAMEAGVEGTTIFAGLGTASPEMKSFLGLPSETEKELVLNLMKEEIADKVIEKIDEKVLFKKKGHGVAFFINTSEVAGIVHASKDKRENLKKEDENMDSTAYELIIAIISKGKSDLVVEATQKAGATGGTIVHGRGTSIHEKGKLFGIPIEPEKEIVLLVTEKDQTDTILAAVVESVEMNIEGNGIAFVLPLDKVHGFR